MDCPFCEVVMEREEGFEKKATSYGFRLIKAVYYYCEECGAELMKLANKPLQVLYSPNENFDGGSLGHEVFTESMGDSTEDRGDEIVGHQRVSWEKCASFGV